VKYVASNASEQAKPQEILRALFARWHVGKWFERAKQEAGLGAFEVRTYRSLVRHWLCVRIAMQFLSEQTARFRGKNPGITFEQVAEVTSTFAIKIWNNNWRSWAEQSRRGAYHQCRNAASYASHRKVSKLRSG